MNGKKGAGGVGIIAAILLVSLIIVLLRDRDLGLLSSVLKTALIISAVLALSTIPVFEIGKAIRRRSLKKKEQ